MSDLVIRESDGWEELGEIPEAIRQGLLDVGDLWGAVGRGSVRKAVRALEEAGFEFEQDVAGVRALMEPDDIHGDFLRVWVKFK